MLKNRKKLRKLNLKRVEGNNKYKNRNQNTGK
jgi:hypothetical protein